jgi:phosphoribosylformylglycinamidine cyclo-ligase
MILHPSRIYTKAVVDAHGGLEGEAKANITGVAHITGGGIPGKIGRMLKPSGLGAELYDLYDPPDIMLICQERGPVKDKEAYKTWGMGQGMMFATDEPDKVIGIAKEYGIEAKEAGEVIPEKIIRIENKGRYSGRERTLLFDLPD